MLKEHHFADETLPQVALILLFQLFLLHALSLALAVQLCTQIRGDCARLRDEHGAAAVVLFGGGRGLNRAAVDLRVFVRRLRRFSLHVPPID